jgi:hypothetical protein
MGCDYNPFRPDNSFGAIEACETVLLAKLKAPSTYKRISAEFFERDPFSYDEYQKYERTKFCGIGENVSPCTDANELMVSMGAQELGKERGYKKPTRKQVNAMRELYWKQAYERYQGSQKDRGRPANVFIKYDAANTFGTPIRGLEECSFGPRIGKKFTTGDLYDPQASIEIE